MLRMAYSVDHDQIVPENDSVDLDIDRTAETASRVDPDQTAENGKRCRPWSNWEWQIL